MQVNVWDFAADGFEISQLSDCLSNTQGNYISWNGGWTLFNIERYEAKLSEFCNEDNSLTTYQWFPKLSRPEAMYICAALGGHLPEVETEGEAKTLHDMADSFWVNHTECQTNFWTALTDEEDEGEWIQAIPPFNEGKTFWVIREPDGADYQNCAMIHPGGNVDVSCSDTYECGICIFDRSVTYSLRGTCEPKIRNVYFSSLQRSLGQLEFYGYGGHHIEFHNNTWIWRKRRNASIIAEMETTKRFPLGRRVWNIYQRVCNQNSGSRVLLFTSCNETQFTCDDGKCVALSSRCDMKYDCQDFSDETNCTLLQIFPGYHQNLPPRDVSETGSALTLAVNLSINFLSVDTLQMTLISSYILQITWYDSRLKFVNLKDQSSLNVLSKSKLADIWIPSVSFVNTENGDSTVVDPKTSLHVSRLANSTSRDLSLPAESKLRLIFLNIY